MEILITYLQVGHHYDSMAESPGPESRVQCDNQSVTSLPLKLF